MTDPNLPPVTPPPAYQPPSAPAYQQPAAPAYGQNAAYQQPYGQQAGPDKYNVMAIVSFVSAFFIQLVAVITGHIALSQIKRTGEKGRGLAIAGLIIGYVGILAGIVVVIVYVLIVVAAVNEGVVSSY